ncbi:MAG TPA: CBS domain-containing protein [Pyrinomonadaceae bacterium]|jgi:CBS domain-containing protein
MKVQDVMTVEVGFISPTDNLAQAAVIMWQRDCGVVPIVDGEGKIAGIVTDRDVCIAVGSRDLKASEIKAEEFCRETIVACAPEEKIKDALKKMSVNQVKRLPVVGQNGELVGIVSVGDILAAIGDDSKLRKKLFSALIEINKPRPITLLEVE